MEFSRQEYWNGLPFPSPEDLPNPGIKSASPARVSCIAGGFFTTEPPGKTPSGVWLTPLYSQILNPFKCTLKYPSYLSSERAELQQAKGHALIVGLHEHYSVGNQVVCVCVCVCVCVEWERVYESQSSWICHSHLGLLGHCASRGNTPE